MRVVNRCGNIAAYFMYPEPFPEGCSPTSIDTVGNSTNKGRNGVGVV